MKFKTGAWSFGGKIPSKFERHIAKSVPLYLEGHQIIVRLSDYFLKESQYRLVLASRSSRPLTKFRLYEILD